MKRALLIFLTVLFYLLHQDFWLWRSATPLVFGFLPPGLFYHAVYTVLTALLLALLVRHLWPSHLESAHKEPEQ